MTLTFFGTLAQVLLPMSSVRQIYLSIASMVQMSEVVRR